MTVTVVLLELYVILRLFLAHRGGAYAKLAGGGVGGDSPFHCDVVWMFIMFTDGSLGTRSCILI